jgi:2-dehydro-3-deoxy-D-gluconate 5-dehydrogenase
MDLDFAGKVALVTGASKGIGRAIALELAEAGADLVVNARGEGALASVAEEIRGRGREVEAVAADVATPGGVASVVERARRRFGRVDILVNNAGIIRRDDALTFSEEDWDAPLNLNLKVPFFLAQAVAKLLVQAGRGGKIINIASMLSFQGGIRTASYTASKSGLAGITRLLANEWAARGINVNAIAPGYFETNNTVALRTDEQRNRDILGRIPAGRWGKPSDLGGAAVFLASAASDYVHGTIIPVDGGWLAR